MEDIKNHLTINEILQVQVPKSPDTATYYSRVNDISEGRLVVAWPTHRGIRLLVHRDQMLEFHYIHDEVPHEFAGLVDELSVKPLPEIIIILSSVIKRVQRRQNFRIKAMIPVEIAGMLQDPRDGSITPLNIRTDTIDLSASGMAIRYSKMIPEGSLLEIKLSLPDNTPVIKLPCCVVYSKHQGDQDTTYRTGIRYLAITEPERARLVRYVYRTQLKGLHP